MNILTMPSVMLLHEMLSPSCTEISINDKCKELEDRLYLSDLGNRSRWTCKGLLIDLKNAYNAYMCASLLSCEYDILETEKKFKNAFNEVLKVLKTND